MRKLLQWFIWQVIPRRKGKGSTCQARYHSEQLELNTTEISGKRRPHALEGSLVSDEDTGVLINQVTIFFQLRPNSRLRSLALTVSPVLKGSLFLKIRGKKKKKTSVGVVCRCFQPSLQLWRCVLRGQKPSTNSICYSSHFVLLRSIDDPC